MEQSTHRTGLAEIPPPPDKIPPTRPDNAAKTLPPGREHGLESGKSVKQGGVARQGHDQGRAEVASAKNGAHEHLQSREENLIHHQVILPPVVKEHIQRNIVVVQPSMESEEGVEEEESGEEAGAATAIILEAWNDEEPVQSESEKASPAPVRVAKPNIITIAHSDVPAPGSPVNNEPALTAPQTDPTDPSKIILRNPWDADVVVLDKEVEAKAAAEFYAKHVTNLPPFRPPIQPVGSSPTATPPSFPIGPQVRRSSRDLVPAPSSILSAGTTELEKGRGGGFAMTPLVPPVVGGDPHPAVSRPVTGGSATSNESASSFAEEMLALFDTAFSVSGDLPEGMDRSVSGNLNNMEKRADAKPVPPPSQKGDTNMNKAVDIRLPQPVRSEPPPVMKPADVRSPVPAQDVGAKVGGPAKLGAAAMAKPVDMRPPQPVQSDSTAVPKVGDIHSAVPAKEPGKKAEGADGGGKSPLQQDIPMNTVKAVVPQSPFQQNPSQTSAKTDQQVPPQSLASQGKRRQESPGPIGSLTVEIPRQGAASTSKQGFSAAPSSQVQSSTRAEAKMSPSGQVRPDVNVVQKQPVTLQTSSQQQKTDQSPVQPPPITRPPKSAFSITIPPPNRAPPKPPTLQTARSPAPPSEPLPASPVRSNQNPRGGASAVTSPTSAHGKTRYSTIPGGTNAIVGELQDRFVGGSGVPLKSPPPKQREPTSPRSAQNFNAAQASLDAVAAQAKALVENTGDRQRLADAATSNETLTQMKQNPATGEALPNASYKGSVRGKLTTVTPTILSAKRVQLFPAGGSSVYTTGTGPAGDAPRGESTQREEKSTECSQQHPQVPQSGQQRVGG
ncbi:uncharacterized protein SPPG_01682 [Spizellomyces punctatus DAOM BR117]|uniref:Uncharacterized protein n=1 Tax=Spizellomyces punctatus (strain DAOM BR117) TaxID=645134 RepID=A0A0L0HT36_SPIPD|nr:uncharacterized protein SPPG_01682 [Spizellomyces punctatus DAOM BR117]KND04252.1 hypothetical protein SPPG_01682 [Spizellomyces punctatus DAOM BR117]|eukprot:XP_016612291.1 hypothetical protein SPPG_01682 [Spizellomyces punctatus DAOM BR117]